VLTFLGSASHLRIQSREPLLFEEPEYEEDTEEDTEEDEEDETEMDEEDDMEISEEEE